ncbi:hypothetical protein PpBr36_05484 [Pyricularia pennisetigena]|uniref:hypothetical protein n=1 Tax=Pyricularia pennisetigena TaxID=1578925 RepID=UPI0011522916|nr:hypothetical protein PpBr36_05484 [Pyricularia pennisetigena]TLS27371.1 hypothetical protein PpBr36_05484 [Pyricularia pennisetigena]
MASLSLFGDTYFLGGLTNSEIVFYLRQKWNPCLSPTCEGLNVLLPITRQLYSYSPHSPKQRAEDDNKKQQLIPAAVWRMWDEEWLRKNREVLSQAIVESGLDNRCFDTLVRDDALTKSLLTPVEIGVWKNGSNLYGLDIFSYDGKGSLGHVVAQEILHRTPSGSQFAFPTFLRVRVNPAYDGDCRFADLLSFEMPLDHQTPGPAKYHWRRHSYTLVACVRCKTTKSRDAVRLYSRYGTAMPLTIHGVTAVDDSWKLGEPGASYMLFYVRLGLNMSAPDSTGIPEWSPAAPSSLVSLYTVARINADPTGLDRYPADFPKVPGMDSSEHSQEDHDASNAITSVILPQNIAIGLPERNETFRRDGHGLTFDYNLYGHRLQQTLYAVKETDLRSIKPAIDRIMIAKVRLAPFWENKPSVIPWYYTKNRLPISRQTACLDVPATFEGNAPAPFGNVQDLESSADDYESVPRQVKRRKVTAIRFQSEVRDSEASSLQDAGVAPEAGSERQEESSDVVHYYDRQIDMVPAARSPSLNAMRTCLVLAIPTQVSMDRKWSWTKTGRAR